MAFRKSAFLFVALSQIFVPTLSTAGTPSVPGFTDTSVATGLGTVTSMAWAPDGSNRLFLTIKTGAIRIIQNGTLLPANFYTFDPETNNETGVESLIFDPNYSANKYIYFFYSVKNAVLANTTQRIVRLTDASNVGQSLTTIVDGLPSNGINHNGGAIVIAPDHNGAGNYLYWTIGDQGSPREGLGDDRTTLASKMGRVTLTGTPPNDNPYYNGTNGIGPEDYIWARGFRNPFTMTVQPGTNKLWVNVVGTGWEQIFIINRGDYAGDSDYENRQPLGPTGGPASVVPVLRYRTGGTSGDNRSLSASPSGAVRNSNIVTFTTTASHTFLPGQVVNISGVADASFNSTYLIKTVPSSTTLTASQTGSNASSGGGTVSNVAIGNCITGGTFYSSTAFPSQYSGNYFFGDYGQHKIYRVTLDGSGKPSSISLFLTNAVTVTDTSVGPDGALYYATAGGVVSRINYTAASQDLIVSPTTLSVNEGGSANFTVRLAVQPASSVSVNITRSGDSDISASPATLSFSTTDWNSAKTVTLSAAEDTDAAVSSSTFTVASTSPALSKTVTATEVENDTVALVLSVNSLTITEGSTANFSVSLDRNPGTTVTVTSQSAGISPNPANPDVSISAGASRSFTSTNFSTPQTVTVSAAHDADLTNDLGRVAVSATGSPNIATRNVDITVTDDDLRAPAIISPARTSAVQGAAYSYDVEATGTPTPTYALSTAPTGMTINSTTGVISWTPTSTGTFSVTVRATNGVSPDATQPFSIIVSADQSPTCSLSAPTTGSTVSGTGAEFFGDCFDDVGCKEARFYIDDPNAVNPPAYVDVNDQEHYHFGGAHVSWNTTNLSNGPHTLTMRVVDTANHVSAACSATNVNIQNIVPVNPPQNLRVTP